MKRIGIDFGSKKIGIAVSDDSGAMAFPKEVVPNDNNFLDYLIVLINDLNISEVVIGHSLNNDGESNEIHKAVEVLMTDLTLQVGIPVHLEPEQYSTQQAAQIQGRNTLTDASAAAIILNSFISKQK